MTKIYFSKTKKGKSIKNTNKSTITKNTAENINIVTQRNNKKQQNQTKQKTFPNKTQK